MRYGPVPFRALLFAILLPPVLYVASIRGLEHYWQADYQRRIANVCSANSDELLSGKVRLETSLPRRLDRFLAEERWPRLGLGLQVSVRSSDGRLLYPGTDVYPPAGLAPEDPLQTAAGNYTMLRDGLQVDVQVRVDHNTVIANTLLAGYLAVALALLAARYRSAQRRALSTSAAQVAAIQDLARQERRQRAILENLDRANAGLRQEIARLKELLAQERHRASRNEEELLKEMVALEGQLVANMEQQRAQEEETARLREAMDDAVQARASKGGGLGATQKRLRALYKEISLTDYAIEGFHALPTPLQIKAEEIIHHLEQDPETIAVKRKVFRGKGKETVFEIAFAHKGRLYFRRNRLRRVDVLAIGTKNRQARDLDFLDRL